MIAQMKKAAGVAAPTTRDDSSPSKNQNRIHIVSTTLLITAFLITLVACNYAELEPLKALVLEVVAVLLLAVREGVVRVDEDWNRRMLAWRRLKDREMDGEPVGRYIVGDGTPRKADGSPYEPLEWGKVRSV